MLENLLLQFFFSHVLNTQIAFATPLESPTLANTEKAASQPIKDPYAVSPIIGAEAAVVYDTASNTILYQKEIHEQRAMASLGKLVLAMIILDSHGLDEKVTVSKHAANQESSKAWLVAGEQFTVSDLLKATLIHSANDAAMALAEFDAGSESAFVEKMNVKGAMLGLQDTHFTNAVGFDTAEHYSTAHDILLFAKAALGYEFIKETVKTTDLDIISINFKMRHKLSNTNQLLKDPYYKVYGIKTGTTPQAGQSLAIIGHGPESEANQNHELIVIVLGSTDRFQEAKVLLNWVYNSYQF